MNLFNKPPLGLKQPKPVRGTVDAKAHMAAVAQLPCVICAGRPVEVHHVFCGRYGSRKASDFEVIPLCPRHHRIGPCAIHNAKETWEQTYGPDYEFLPVVADMLAGELNF